MSFGKKYILITGLLFSLLILATGGMFLWSLSYIYDILAPLSAKVIEQGVLSRSRLFMDNASRSGIGTPRALLTYADAYKKIDAQFYELVLYQRTEDDRFFREIGICSAGLHKVPADITLPGKDIIMRKGLIHPVFDPVPQRRDAITVYSLYHPVSLSKRQYLARILMTNPDTKTMQTLYKTSMSTLKFIMLSVIIFVAGGVITLTLSFTSSYEAFLRELTAGIRDAARGEYRAMRPPGDDELAALAESFNSLIEDIRSRENAPPDEQMPEYFKNAVQHLKNGDLERARYLFEAILDIRPDSFGSLFNLGALHARQKNFIIAIEYFTRALTVNPGHALTAAYIEKVHKLIDQVS